MKAELKAKWIEALRSGEYTQSRGSIGRKDRKHLCCLGVGAVALKPSVKLATTDDALDVLVEGGFENPFGAQGSYTKTTRSLIDLNDKHGKSFAEIADYIEANIPADEHSVSELNV